MNEAKTLEYEGIKPEATPCNQSELIEPLGVFFAALYNGDTPIVGELINMDNVLQAQPMLVDASGRNINEVSFDGASGTATHIVVINDRGKVMQSYALNP